MKFNSNFEYDLALGKEGENLLAKILSNKKVEVKKDFKAHKTGNIYIEIKSRGSWSGISTTKADYIVYIIGDTGLFLIFETKILQKIIKYLIQTVKTTKGGDSNTSIGVLLKINKLNEYLSLLSK